MKNTGSLDMKISAINKNKIFSYYESLSTNSNISPTYKTLIEKAQPVKDTTTHSSTAPK